MGAAEVVVVGAVAVTVGDVSTGSGSASEEGAIVAVGTVVGASVGIFGVVAETEVGGAVDALGTVVGGVSD